MKFFSGICIATLVASCLVFTACEKTVDEGDLGSVRTYYDFSDVDYSEATERMNLLVSLIGEIRKANTEGTSIEAQTLIDFYKNDTEGTIDLEDLFYEVQSNPVALLDQFVLLEDLSKNFSTLNTGDSGAGIVVSGEGDSYLLDANGIELGEIIRQRLLGGIVYYAGTNFYLGENFMLPTLSQTEPNRSEEIAVMEKAIDNSFGYFGAPVDFPINDAGLLFYAAESHEFDPIALLDQDIMDAFIKVRAGITEADMNTRNSGVFELRVAWERVLVASALHSLNQMRNSFNDRAVRNHHWSVVYGYMGNLSQNPGNSIVPSQSDSVYNYLRDNPDVIAKTDVDTVQMVLARAYNMTDIKDDL